MHGRALLQSSPQQPGDSGEGVAHPVDVFAAAAQQRRVPVGQTSDLQQQRVVKAVLHAAQEGHQVDQRAVSMSLHKGDNRGRERETRCCDPCWRWQKLNKEKKKMKKEYDRQKVVLLYKKHPVQCLFLMLWVVSACTENH